MIKLIWSLSSSFCIERARQNRPGIEKCDYVPQSRTSKTEPRSGVFSSLRRWAVHVLNRMNNQYELFGRLTAQRKTFLCSNLLCISNIKQLFVCRLRKLGNRKKPWHCLQIPFIFCNEIIIARQSEILSKWKTRKR